MSLQRQYGINRGGINSVITAERLYRVEPLTVGNTYPNKPSAGLKKQTKETNKNTSLAASDAECNTC